MIRSAAVLVLMWWCGQSMGQGTPLKLGDFTDRDRYSFISMSPDGKHLAYWRYNASAEENFVEFLDIDKQKISNTLPTRSYRPDGLEWVDNRRVAVFGGALYSVSLDGSELQPLLEPVPADDKRRYKRSVFLKGLEDWWYIGGLPGDDETVLIGSYNRKEQMRVHKMDLFSGRFVDVVDGAKPKITKWYLNSDGAPVVGVREERSGLKYLIRNGEDWVAHDDIHANGPVRLNHKASFRDGAVRIVAALDNESDVLLALRDTDGVFDLVVYDVVAGSVKRSVKDESRYSLRPELNELALVRDSATRRISSVTYLALDPATVFVDEGMTAAQSLMQGEYADSKFVPVAGSTAARRWLYRLIDPARGDEYVLVDLAANSTQVLFDERSEAAAEMFPAVSSLRIKASDGAELDAYLWEPPAGMERKAPILVAQHTRFGRHAGSYDIDLLYFAARGHPVLQINPRGMVGYGYPSRRAGLEQRQTRMLDDLETAANWLRSDPRTKNPAVFGFGIATGGHAMFTMATRSPGTLTAISTYATPVDLVAQQKQLDDDPSGTQSEYLTLSVQGAGKPKRALTELSPIKTVENLSTPAFMFHSGRDPWVSIDDFERFVKRAEKLSDDFEHSQISKKLSGMSDPGVRERYLELILRFFERHSS